MTHELLCPEREENGDGGSHHCFHPAGDGLEVCCWCGDLFVADYANEVHHGPYSHAGSSNPDDLRAAGWAVAVHNDYRQDGKAHTFWLFTKDGRAVKGEGLTDAEALDQVRHEIEPSDTGDQIVTLFRAVGEAERLLIEQSNFTAFPPRLPEQPIFYPVCNREYADQMARDWNTKDPKTGKPDGRKGYVTRFHVQQAFLNRYEVHQVGGPVHQEYWIPAEELGEFNINIVGPIEVVAEFGGTG